MTDDFVDHHYRHQTKEGPMNGLLRFARLVASSFVTAGLVLLATATPQVTAQQGGTTIIAVTAQDSTGTPVKNAGVNVHTTDFKKNFFGRSDATGAAVVQDFNSQIAAGDSLILDVFPPFDSAGGGGLIAPDTVTLGTYSGSPFASRTVQFKAATKTLNIEATTASGTPATSVKVNVFKESGGFAQATTDATGGKATVKLSGGRWNLHGEPSDKFAMTGPPVQVSFKDDGSVETQTVKLDNFVPVNAKVIGKVVTADGSALTQGTGIGINSGHDFGTGAPIQGDGTFSVSVPGDRAFNLDIFSPPNLNNPNAAQWAAPSLDPFTVKVGETKDLGTITLQKKTAKITVKVKNGAAGMMAFAFSLKSHEFSNASLTASGSDAEGTITVLGGRSYMVMVMAESFGPPSQQQTTINKVVKGGPQNVTVVAGGTGALSFEALDADATINVRVLKSTDSSVVKDSFGFLEVNNDEVGFLGKPIERGTATLRVPGGRTYTLNPMMPLGGFMPEGTTTLTPAVNSTNAVDIKMIPTDATFKVSFVKSDGTGATGIFAHAFAISNDGVNASGEFGGHGGAAVSNVSVVAGKGPYRIGAFVEPGSGFAMVPPSDKYTIAAGETKEVKVTLKSLDSKIKGKVTDPDGNGVAGAFVKIDNGADDDQADSKGPVDHFFEFGGQSDKDGNYSLDVTSNETHNVRVFLPPELLNKNGWLAAKEVAVKIGDKETKTGIDLKFRKADSEITGTITGSGPLEEVLVSGYSNDGAFNQVRTDSNGKYKMAATKGTVWHIDAAKDSGDKDAYFLTGEKLVDTTDKTSLTQNMDLTKQTDVLLPEVTRSGSSDNAIQISLKDGMSIQVPANALDEDNDGATATVTVSKTAELPSQEGGTPIGPGYDVTATASGEEIEKPNSSLTMTFPYKEADLTALGISEKELANKVSVVSYDESTGAFRKEAGVIFDTDKNLATVSVDHMTVFGLTANADTTPPAAPSDVKATDLGTDGKIKVEWKNPTDSDFKSVKIYRSTTSGSLGTAVHTGVTGTSKEDTGLTNGTNYYYTVRSVDATGNESINTNQVSATPSKSSLPKTGQTIPSPLIWLAGVGLIALLYSLQRRHAR